MSQQWDVIVVGAGTAGCLVATGLAERRELRVLVLEAGPDHTAAQRPQDLRSGSVVPVDGPYDWGLSAAVVGARRGPVSRGRVVGGSAQINDRGAWRPPAADFGRWAAQGSPGWAWDDVLPSFRAVESDQQFGDRPEHGSAGPIPITRWGRDELLPAMDALLEGAISVGHPFCEDLNAPEATGIGLYPQNRVGATRASTATAYLDPAREAGQVDVRGGATVSRVVVRDGVAVGVELEGGEQLLAGRVVLAAGAPFSAAILLRSGIGPTADLVAAGVDPVLDLPGVGQSLRDQPGAVIPIVPTAAAGSPPWPRTQVVARMAALPGHEPDDAFYLSMFSGMPIPQVDQMAGRVVPTLVMVGDLAPRSCGHARLRPEDPGGLPEVDLNFYSAPGDLERMMAAYRGGWEIVNSAPYSATVEQVALVDDATVGDDAALAGLLRGMTSSRWNLLGGACMGAPDDPMAVVDERCSVRGLAGLSVVDASIVPVALRAPAALTVIMLAEHAIDRIP